MKKIGITSVTRITLVACISALTSFAAVAANPTLVYTANAYGTQVAVGGVVKVGPIAPVTTPACSTQTDFNDTGTGAAVSDGPLAITGAVNTSASSSASSSTGSSDLSQLNLLGGLITADEVKSVSTTSMDNSGVLHVSAAGTTLSNLVVLGIRQSATPAANTTIELPLIGRVVLNEQITSSGASQASLTVNALHVYVTIKNLLGYPIGTEIIISNAVSALQKVAGPAVVDGYAFGPNVSAGPIQSSGITVVNVPCTGTNGVVKSDSVASVNVPGIVGSGTVKATEEANINTSGTNSQTSITIQGLNLLSGLLSATAIQASATGTTSNGQNFNFTGGTTFTGISVAGHPEITVNVAPNNQVTIAGVGTLYLNTVQKHSDYIRVVPVELVVGESNSYGLPIGADIKAGVAEASLHSASIP